MYDYATRTYLAILNEFEPDWRDWLSEGPAVFAARWVDLTAQGRASGFRWYHRALEIRIAELAQAA